MGLKYQNPITKMKTDKHTVYVEWTLAGINRNDLKKAYVNISFSAMNLKLGTPEMKSGFFLRSHC